MWSVLHNATIKTATFLSLEKREEHYSLGTAESSGQLAAYPMERHKTLQLKTCFRVVEAGKCTGLLRRLVG
jgi:hypothetical protein